MNTQDTQTVKGIVGENFISSQQKISCIKTETWPEEDGIKVTIIWKLKTQQDIIQS